MKTYIDLFLILNIIIDYTIILSTSIILKRRTTKKRIILSSLIGGLSSLLLFTPINKLLIEVLTIIIISLITFKYKTINYTLKNILYMYLLSTLLGGIIYLFNIKVIYNIPLTYLIIIIITIEVSILYIKEIKKIKTTYHNYYPINIQFKDQTTITTTGFLDTGNNLHDPYQKHPIIILMTKQKINSPYLLVPYYTASGEGLLKCYKPAKVTIEDKDYPFPLLVGVTNKKPPIEGIEVILHKEVIERMIK